MEDNGFILYPNTKSFLFSSLDLKARVYFMFFVFIKVKMLKIGLNEREL